MVPNLLREIQLNEIYDNIHPDNYMYDPRVDLVCVRIMITVKKKRNLAVG